MCIYIGRSCVRYAWDCCYRDVLHSPGSGDAAGGRWTVIIISVLVSSMHLQSDNSPLYLACFCWRLHLKLVDEPAHETTEHRKSFSLALPLIRMVKSC